jgi:ATP-dependent DNA helicase RecQ
VTAAPTSRRPSEDEAQRLVERVAAERFGWESLRPGQADAAVELVQGRDALVVMPTGYGKSAVYQLAGLAMPGPTVVVSPLIALQHDQVSALQQTGVRDAVVVNSAQDRASTEQAWEALGAGDAEFVFLAPEQLARPDVVERLRDLRPSLLVVDEAHCVSRWGHDFRPEYLRLGEVVEALDHPVVAGLTATAAPPVREEVVERLGMRDPFVLVAGFDRPNLFLEVERAHDAADKRERVLLRAATAAKPGLLYVATRRDAESYADELAGLGLDVAAYHAGLRAGDRRSVHERFSSGDLDVVVATSAFGMGIDKADVRFVVHASVTDSLDSYYQEVGRAGRDGDDALASLFYRPEDLGLQRFLGSGGADQDALRRVGRVLRGGERVSRKEIRSRSRLSAAKVTSAVNLLEQAGAVEVDSRGVAWVEGVAPARAVREAVEVAEARRRAERSRLEMLRGYAETTSCRRRYLLAYFGEELPEPCGRCDTCRDGTAAEAERAVVPQDAPEGLVVDARVRHREWGDGVVMSVEADRVTVLLEEQGYRTLALDALAGSDILEVVDA